MRLFGHRLPITALIGLLIIAVNVVAALGAPLIAPYDQAAVLGDAWADPTPQYVLGLDDLGRDLFSRLLYGARMSIGLAFVVTCLSFAVGIVTGFAAAVLRGWVDMLLSRIVDLLLSMPTLIFAFIILSVLGTALPVLIVTIAILDSTKVFRLARALAMNIAALEYVEVAKVRGEGLWWVIRKEIFPNAVGAAGGGVRPALLLRVPVHRGAELPRPRRAAAGGRLGQHGPRLSRHDQSRRDGAAVSRRRHRHPDHRRQLRRGLDAGDPFARTRRRRMSGRRVGDDILRVEGLRVEVRDRPRTGAGAGR